MTTIRVRKLTPIEQIKQSTSISNATKELLDTIPKQDRTPYPLMKWVRETFQIGLEQGLDYSEVARHVRIYAQGGNWSDKQIDATIRYVISYSFIPKGKRYLTYKDVTELLRSKK